MEEFSYAYIYALACQSGLTFRKEEKGLDNVGIDIFVKDPQRAYELPPVQFFAQVKCVRKSKLTSNRDGSFCYQLKKKYYDSLTKSQPGNTILLFVLVVPDEVEEWIIFENSSIIVKHELYWFCFQGLSLSGLTHPDSKQKVPLCSSSLFTTESFPLVMQKIADGEI